MTSDVLKNRKKSEKCTVKKIQTNFFGIFFVLCSYVLMSHKNSKIIWVKSCYLHK
jgi:hypothetical protein